MLVSDEKKLPLSHACLWILLSILLVSGIAFMGWLYYLHVKDLRLNDDQYRIVAIIQKSPQKESLKTMYLAQLLGLSLDQPTNIFKFNSKKGEKKLIASPLIKAAKIQKIRPGTLYIDYQIRTPLAYIGNYSNAAIDQEGFLLPFRPFFTPKSLPTIYLDENRQNISWGISLKNSPDFDLALKVLERLEPLTRQNILVTRIDVSQAFEENLGKRQIVVLLEEPLNQYHKTCLRLNAEHYAQNLVNYMTIRQKMPTNHTNHKGKIIDFRISHLAFIKEEI